MLNTFRDNVCSNRFDISLNICLNRHRMLKCTSCHITCSVLYTGCRPADVIFSVPDEAGIRDTNTSLTFIQSLISDIDIGVGAVRVGLTPRICADRYPIPLNGYDTLSGYKVSCPSE